MKFKVISQGVWTVFCPQKKVSGNGKPTTVVKSQCSLHMLDINSVFSKNLLLVWPYGETANENSTALLVFLSQDLGRHILGPKHLNKIQQQ